MIVYKVTNKINGHVYIGWSSKTRRQRILVHLKSKQPFGKALKKYGLNSFTYETIDVADTKEEILKKEIYWIAFYCSHGPNGYNLTDGGEGVCGVFGAKHHNYGKRLNAVSDRNKKQVGSLNPMYGKSRPDLAKWCREHTGMLSPVYGAKRSDRARLNKEHVYVRTQEIKDKISAGVKAHYKRKQLRLVV